MLCRIDSLMMIVDAAKDTEFLLKEVLSFSILLALDCFALSWQNLFNIALL